MQALVNTGTPTGYQSTFTMEALVQMLIQNLIHDNPWAHVGAGRIDFEREREVKQRTLKTECCVLAALLACNVAEFDWLIVQRNALP